MRKFSYLTLLALFSVFFTLTVSAQVILQPFLSGLNSPVYMTNAGDGTNRLFVVEQGGTIKVVQPGSTTPTVFMNMSSKISTGGERGLLGLAFHPQYETNRRFFVYYTRKGTIPEEVGDIQIAEYLASTTTPQVGDLTTERVIITIEHTSRSNHNGGTVAFGADGFLYAGIGDGGGSNDPDNNGQRLNSLLGKFIRIDINNTGTARYLIPATNPFTGVGTTTCDNDTPSDGSTCREIYAYGFRNPFRFSFDRSNGNLWAGDVGQDNYEEIDIVTSGGNFGWKIREGFFCTPGVNPNCGNAPSGHIPPVYSYAIGSRRSITGGNVYRGSRNTFTPGTYLYSDYVSGEIMTGSGPTVLLNSGRNVVAFGEDEAGELYIVGLGGTVDKLISNTTTAASVTVGGRVMTANGRGIRNIVVTMTDEDGNVRTARSTSFGSYRFADVPAGATYIFSVSGKRFTFRNNTQVQSIVEDTDGINFVAGNF